MDDNKLRFGVGVLVIAAIGLGIILTFLFGAFPTVLNREYELLVEFPSAEGVSTNKPVLRDGVRIGRVTEITLLEKEGVLLRLGMDDNRKLSHEYIPRIGTGSVITGDATLEFVRADEPQLAVIFPTPEDQQLISQQFTDGEYVRYGYKATDPFSMLFDMEGDLLGTMESIRRAADSLQQAGQGFNTMVQNIEQRIGGTDEKFGMVTDEAVAALEEFQGAMRDARSLLGDPEMQADLKRAVDELPKVLDEAQATLQSFERAGNQFEKVGTEAESTVKNVNEAVDIVRGAAKNAEKTFASAEKTVQNLEQFTEPLGERGEELVAQVLQTLRSVDGALTEVRTFSAALNNNDGTLRRLLEDDEIYYSIRRVIANVEQASAKIRPIMDDVRIFTDKIARDPREIGLRGAITRRPSGMGLK